MCWDSGGGGSSNVTQVQQVQPWEGAVPLLTDVMNLGQGLEGWFNQNLFQGGGINPNLMQQVAGQTPEQTMARQAINYEFPIMNQALAGTGGYLQNQMTASQPSQWMPVLGSAIYGTDPSTGQRIGPGLTGTMAGVGVAGALPAAGAAEQSLQDTLSGKYLYANANPYLQSSIAAATDPLYQRLNEQILPNISASAEASGRYGSGGMAGLQSQAIRDVNRQAADTASQMSLSNLATERANQQQAANLANQMFLGQQGMQLQAAQYPMDLWRTQLQAGMQSVPQMYNLLGQNLKNIGALESTGETQQAYQQQLLDALRANAMQTLTLPYDLTAMLGNLGMGGGKTGWTSTQTTPMYVPSLGQSLLGAGMSGMGMYGMASQIPGLAEYAPYIGALSGLGMLL